MKTHRCKNCDWWDNQHRAVGAIPIKLHKVAPGFCRKHKPGAIAIEQYYYGVQPVMDADEFCGEFREEQR